MKDKKLAMLEKDEAPPVLLTVSECVAACATSRWLVSRTVARGTARRHRLIRIYNPQ